MPVVQGKIDLKGPIEFEGYLHDENTDVKREQSCTREVRGTVGSRKKNTHTAMREGLEQLRERLRTSTPRTQLRERERENSPQGGAKDGKRERADDCREEEKSGEPPTYHYLAEMLEDLAGCHRHMTSGCEGQAEEPEETPEGRMTPADSIQEVQDGMEERCNRTREDLKQAVHMTKEEFEKTVNSLHQELDELIDKRKPMQSHPSPHDCFLRKQYKQVAGTLVMQDIEPPEDQVQVHLTRRQRGREEHRSTRASREAEAPRFKCPILIKQGYAQYIPWAGQDLDTLVTRLPDIHEGAGKWIRTFEEETVGKLLALGDIKALLAKCLGVSKMNDILEQSSLLQAVDRPQEDGISFDKHRHNIWMTLRAEYPMQTDPGFLKGEPMEETENPITYIQKQLRHWKEELERDPEKDKILTALFRTAIVEAMPSTVKVKLEDVVGLNSKSHKEFRDHVVHALEQYRRQQLKVKDQEKELQRKLYQMQLDELLNKKKKVQAVQKEDQSAVMAPVNTSVLVNPSAPMNVHPPAFQTAKMQMTPAETVKTPQGPAPVVIYLKPEQPNNRNWNRQQQQGGRGRGRFNNNQQRVGGSPRVCWGCNQPGHNRRECPINPWQNDQHMAPEVNYGADNDETAYREEVSTLTKWCQENHLSLNIDKTKELVVDYRRQSREHTPITIDKTPVERVTSFKFLGVHITEDLTWSAHTDAVLKKAHQRLFFLRRLRKFGTSPRILRSFYTCTVESILTGCITAWFGNSTAGNRRALQRVVRTARHIVGGELPSLQDIYTRRCTRKARRIIKDSSHPSHRLLSLLPSGRRFRSIRSRTSRLRDSFFPQAIRLMNSQK